jgi:acyl-coenzyme A synthetase/AMP-(fatty) acid ligase
MFKYMGLLVRSKKIKPFLFIILLFLKKVSPSEIESVLQEHPAVLAAGVIGMPNPETNSLARAFVVLRPDQTCTPEELCLFVEKKLPKFKHLHGGVKIVDNLPSTKIGKIDKKKLKALALMDDATH